MEQDLPTGRKKRWEATASACCLLAGVVVYELLIYPFEEETTVVCAILAGFGIVLAVSAIRQRCASRIMAWTCLVLLVTLTVVLVFPVLSDEVLRNRILPYWRHFFGH